VLFPPLQSDPAISTPACVSAPSPSRCGHGCWAKSVCLSLSTLVSTVVQFPTLMWSLDGSAGGRRSAAWCARANRNARLCDDVCYCEESPFYFYKVLCRLYLCSFTFVCYYCLRLYIIHIALFSHLGRVRYFRYGYLILRNCIQVTFTHTSPTEGRWSPRSKDPNRS